MAKVTVVIITYKRPVDILMRAVRSVINQTYKDWELYVVNDAPTEIELCSCIKQSLAGLNDSRIKYLSYEKNHGSNYARNYGLKYSRSEYIAFLDDDDEWLPKKLEKQVYAMDKSEDIALVSCGFYLHNENRIVGEKKTFPNKDIDIHNLLVGNYIGSTSFPLLRRKYVIEAGGFDVDMASCQEYDLWIRLRLNHSFRSISEPLGVYYISPDSVYKKDQERFYNGDMRILEKYRSLFANDKDALNIHLNDMAFNFLVAKDYKHYFEYKKKALKTRPLCLANFIFLYKIFTKGR